jgi:hypothetical protein
MSKRPLICMLEQNFGEKLHAKKALYIDICGYDYYYYVYVTHLVTLVQTHLGSLWV